MNNNQLNEYIFHYLQCVKIPSAIMLTGDWGSGKSFYVNNNLKGHLKGKGKDCVVVSLYDIKNLNELSKTIFISLFIKNKKPKWRWFRKPKIKKLALLSKVMVTNFINIININISIAEKDLQKVYSLANYKDTLIILEDLERSSIDVNEVLAFVSNLVEQDNAKVLLVANERAILEPNILLGEGLAPERDCSIEGLFSKKDDIKEEPKKEPEICESVKRYKATKEKTISDTVNFYCDTKASIVEIIKKYEFDNLEVFTDGDNFEELVNIVESNGCNLRIFIYACQKANDIISKLNMPPNDLVKHIFFSIVLFSYIYKSDQSMSINRFNAPDNFRVQKYWLFNSCYSYLVEHKIDDNVDEVVKNEFKNFKLYQREESSNENLIKLYNYYIIPEKILLEAIENIKNSLANDDEVPLKTYGKLAYYIVVVSQILKINIDEIGLRLINNLRGLSNEFNSDELFFTERMHEGVLPMQYIELRDKMIASLNVKDDKSWLGIDYNPEKLKDAYVDYFGNKSSIPKSDSFVSDIDIDKFTEMVKKCNPEQLHDLRGLFLGHYRVSNAKELYGADREKLIELYQKVELTELFYVGDEIKKLQMKSLVSNLLDIIEKL